MNQWLIWCHLNAEQDMLESKFKDRCVSIRGATPMDKKIEYERMWREGEVEILISKPSVFGFGLNWQHCHNVVFVGLSDSFEEYYQAVRRCWRFGQEHQVNVHIITSEAEGAVVQNIKEKERRFNEMLRGMISASQEITKENIRGSYRMSDEYNPQEKMVVPGWL